MSVPRSVVLKPAARRDVRSILLYTGEQWGAAQREAYLEEINRALATLSANPRIGRERSEIVPDLRSYGVQQHSIFYRLDDDIVTVLRILHRKMDAAPLLAE